MEKEIKEIYAFMQVHPETGMEYIAEIRFGHNVVNPAMTTDKEKIPLIVILLGEKVKDMKLKKFVFQEEVPQEELGKMLDRHNEKIWNQHSTK